MKVPLRVAVIGCPDRKMELLVAALSPAFQPRLFRDWAALDDSFDAETLVLLPGVPHDPPPALALPLLTLHSADLWSVEELEARIHGAKIPAVQPQSRLLGRSAAMAKVRGALVTTAKTPLPILLTGENGTGKDLAASVAHELSARAGQPFVAVNCGAVPTALAETEFFGCVRGAFTGAETRTGFCHQALGGTLFLDEVGEMPAEIQSKLLRVLENHELRRVGSSRLESTDFRLICATNRDLAAEVRAGRFREDLYYRINVLSLRMPPLRERTEDLPILIDHFLHSESIGLDRRVKVGPQGLAKLSAYHWPGNLRQLRNVLLRAAVLNSGPELGPEALEWES